MLSTIAKIFNFLLDGIFPKTCFGCASTGSYFCNDCIKYIPKQVTQRCIFCQKPSLLGLTHPKCKNTITPDRLTTIYNYNQFPIKQLIIAGKYQFAQEIFYLFAKVLMVEVVIKEQFIICEVPLSKKRQRWRGFNQATILAKQFSNNSLVTYRPLLHRSKNTKIQKELPKVEREQNLKNVFSLLNNSNMPDKIIIIDDVTTTGTTFLEAAKILKQAGAKYVWCVAIAQD